MPSCPPPSSLLQPRRLEKLIGLIIKRKVFHGLPIGLEVGIGRDVHPLELVGEAALYISTDRLALLWLQRPPPLVHHVFQLRIVDAHIVRLPALEEAH